MEFIKTHTPSRMERGMDLASKPLTPKSERPRHTWGSLSMSVQTVKGRCTTGRKCVLKQDHSVPCWPADS